MSDALSRRLFLGGVAATALTADACSSGEAQRPSSDPSAHTTGPVPGAGTATPSASPTSSPEGTPTPRSSFPTSDLLHGPRSRPAVALTFHGAGDPSLTRTALRIAAAHHATVTVLAVGSWLEQNPHLAAAILDGGHDLGNHTWSHLPMRHLSSAQARREISRAAAVLTSLTGSAGSWFRPSGTPRSTATIRAAAAASGYRRCLAYDLDPMDYTDPGSALVVRRVRDGVRNGSIVSLHLGHAGTIAALPAILDDLAGRGISALSMSNLMNEEG
jgi:peptidoglycan/xylan/chitin deacetylase (PgdA/CDA1 family)